MRLTPSLIAAALLLGCCPPVQASAFQHTRRNRAFLNSSVAAEAEGFSYASKVSFHQLLASDEQQPTGALLCPDGVCVDGSCCGKNGKCGFEDENCGVGNCTSNCNAKAMCGRRSKDGKAKCGMNLCCSYSGWCGYQDVHCTKAPGFDTGKGEGECQKGFGYCGDPAPMMPKVHSGGASSSGRKIGYWQSSNVHRRQSRNGKFKCPPMRPGDIPLDRGPLGGGWTHLNYAFGAINPITFQIVDDPSKRSLYREFTDLKHKLNGPQTWMAIGGFDFSDPGVNPSGEADTAPGVSTHGTWSNMAASASNRKTFIDSLLVFMAKYGFQGVDLDWEYPVAEDRGGTDADTENFVALVKEMRAAFGTQYGISVALAPDIWYLRYFDALAMQPYVDWFGFMAYDLHGVWASDEKHKKVRGQTEADEIYMDIIPLSFAGLDFSKINFGMALYGRGYKLADPKCSTMDGSCSWTDGSEAGECTSFSGVLALDEIVQKVAEAKQQGAPGPTLDSKKMMKYFTWGQNGDNWIGYDDKETWEMKKANLADKYGFGGTMFWSVDFLGQGVNTTDVFLDPALVCKSGDATEKGAQCNPPCRFIMPQCQIPRTTITADYEIGVEVYNGPSSTTTTTTITTRVVVTTDQASHEPVYVGNGRTPGEVFNPITIVPMPPITINITHADGRVTPRSIPLPNWPRTGKWPGDPEVTPNHAEPWLPMQRPSSTSGAPTATKTGTSLTSFTSDASVPPIIPWVPDMPEPEPLSWSLPTNRPAATTSPATTSPATTTTTATTTTAPILPLMTWPPNSIEPTDGDPDDDDLPCGTWFFFICIRWPKINITRLKLLPLPPGLYVWPPPGIKPPAGITITFNPEPKITLTRGTDNKWTTPRPQDEQTKCTSMTTVYDTMVLTSVTLTVKSRRTTTTTFTVTSTRIPRSGCSIQQGTMTKTGETTRTTVSSCPYIPEPTRDPGLKKQRENTALVGRGEVKEIAPSIPPGMPPYHEQMTNLGTLPLHKRMAGAGTPQQTDCKINRRAILIPVDPFDAGDVEKHVKDFTLVEVINGQKVETSIPYKKISAPNHKNKAGKEFIAGFALEWFTAEFFYDLRDDEVLNKKVHFGQDQTKWVVFTDLDSSTPTPKKKRTTFGVEKRAVWESSGSWELSQLSVPKNDDWTSDAYQRKTLFGLGSTAYKEYFHTKQGEKQQAYMLESTGVPWADNVEFANNGFRAISMQVWGGRTTSDHPESVHPTQVGAKLGGKVLGVAKKASLFAASPHYSGASEQTGPMRVFRNVEALVGILDNVAADVGTRGKGNAVINFSTTIDAVYDGSLKHVLLDRLTDVLVELHSLGAVIVMATDNDENKGTSADVDWPSNLADPTAVQANKFSGVVNQQEFQKMVSAVIMVGATTKAGDKASFCQGAVAKNAKVWAPGEKVYGVSRDSRYIADAVDGTSVAAPLVAGLVAYYRSIAYLRPNSVFAAQLESPDKVRWMLIKLSRKIKYGKEQPRSNQMPVVWNGQVREPAGTNSKDWDDLSCLHPSDRDKMTPLTLLQCPDVEDVRFWKEWSFWNQGGTFTPGAGGSDSGEGQGADENNNPYQRGPGITWNPGSPGPLCEPLVSGTITKRNFNISSDVSKRDLGPTTGAGLCGVPCNDDWYCDSWPDGMPPFYMDPLDPNNPYKDGRQGQYPGSGPLSPGGHGPQPSNTQPASTDMLRSSSTTGNLLTGLPTLTGTNPGPKPTGSCLASGAVVQCNGRACITSTTCTKYATAGPATTTAAKPTTTTKQSPAPSPIPKSYQIVIALQELHNYDDMGGSWTRSWVVFSAPLTGSINVCNDRPMLDEHTIGGTASNPGFPPSLGPLRTNNFRCEYKGKDNGVGILVCEGVQNTWCEKIQNPGSASCGPFHNPVTVPVVICRW